MAMQGVVPLHDEITELRAVGREPRRRSEKDMECPFLTDTHFINEERSE